MNVQNEIFKNVRQRMRVFRGVLLDILKCSFATSLI